MKSLWNVSRVLMALVGVILIYCGASTSDYYLIELSQPEPEYIGTMLKIGVVLMLPSLVHAIRTGGVWNEIKQSGR